MLRHERAHYYAGNHNMNEPRFAIKDTKHRHGSMREVLHFRLQLETLVKKDVARDTSFVTGPLSLPEGLHLPRRAVCQTVKTVFLASKSIDCLEKAHTYIVVTYHV